MKKRLTFVGIAPCGHPGYVAQDPETYKHRLRVEDVAEEYKSLVDDLRHYAQHGQVRLVDDDQLAPLIEQMKSCRCPPRGAQ